VISGGLTPSFTSDEGSEKMGAQITNASDFKASIWRCSGSRDPSSSEITKGIQGMDPKTFS